MHDMPPPGPPRRPFGITRAQWTVIALTLTLAVLLMVGGLLPARERSRELLEKNSRIADEILQIDGEMRTLEHEVEDLRHDPQAWERELRRRGATIEGEELVPEIPAEAR